LIDFPATRQENDNMRRMNKVSTCVLGVAAAGCILAALPSEIMAQGSKPGAVYYCPDRTPDQQISGRPAPGCVPLIDKAAEAAKAEKRDAARKKGQEIEERPPVLIENLEREISSFLGNYRKFLGCCVNAPDSLDTIEDLEDRASGLLKDIQEKGLTNMQTNQRGITLTQMISPVAQAKLDLGKLRKKLESLDQAKDRLSDLDSEPAGRERRRIQQEEDALSKDFRPTVPPGSARTGTGISETTTPNKYGETVGDTTLKPATGGDIGTVVSPGSDQEQSLRPRTGLDTQSSTLTPRHGAENQDTTLPSSTGFEGGTSQGPTGQSSTPSRAGAAIGDSNLNQR
jgi:hypothetical protein